MFVVRCRGVRRKCMSGGGDQMMLAVAVKEMGAVAFVHGEAAVGLRAPCPELFGAAQGIIDAAHGGNRHGQWCLGLIQVLGIDLQVGAYTWQKKAQQLRLDEDAVIDTSVAAQNVNELGVGQVIDFAVGER